VAKKWEALSPADGAFLQVHRIVIK
ncbi:hypothetical protein A2U01_0099616, partial [Trifolium medium]|nr:hypothetical protein [Trifolium medium]